MARLVFICFLFACPALQSQTLTNLDLQIMGAAGDHCTQNDLEMSWTLGQTAIITDTLNSLIFTQGFQQSEDVFLNVYTAIQQQLIITPNSDGLNDVLILEDLQNFPENDIHILNRWGSPVFAARPYLNDWYGQNFHDRPLPEGTYYYYVRLEPGGAKTLYGSVTIKR